MSAVIGVPQLLARFARAAALAEVAEVTAKEELAEEVEERAKAIVPVDTGTLRDSITHDANGVRTDIAYAPFVEFGTSDTPAQPFMRPAADTVDGDKAAEVGAVVMRRA